MEGLREHLPDILRKLAAHSHEFLLEYNGQPVAALMPPEAIQLVRDLEDRLDGEEALLALKEAEGEGTIPWEDIAAKHGLLSATD